MPESIQERHRTKTQISKELACWFGMSSPGCFVTGQGNSNNSVRTLPELDCACMIYLLHHAKRDPSS
ncbi:hypothetical protein LEMLEM_LOCUS15787 [Lemmus lemmus]